MLFSLNSVLNCLHAVLNCVQATTLLLFNTSDRLSYQDIKSLLNLTDDDVTRLLHSLSCAKYKILKKEPDTETVSSTDTFEFNAMFTAKTRKIEVLPFLYPLNFTLLFSFYALKASYWNYVNLYCTNWSCSNIWNDPLSLIRLRFLWMISTCCWKCRSLSHPWRRRRCYKMSTQIGGIQLVLPLCVSWRAGKLWLSNSLWQTAWSFSTQCLR